MLIRVLQIAPSNGKFCFGGGNLVPFVEVDWFTDDGAPPELTNDVEKRDAIVEFIKKKNYYSEHVPLLILSKKWFVTLNYDGT